MSICDTNMKGVGADEGRSICGYETCDVSDFYISDMIVTSLPFGGNSFDDDISETNCLSDYGYLSTIALSLKDLVSVKERREHFLQGLGLADSTNQLSCA